MAKLKRKDLYLLEGYNCGDYLEEGYFTLDECFQKLEEMVKEFGNEHWPKGERKRILNREKPYEYFFPDMTIMTIHTPKDRDKHIYDELEKDELPF